MIRWKPIKTALSAVKDCAVPISFMALAHDGSLNGIKRRLAGDCLEFNLTGATAQIAYLGKSAIRPQSPLN